MGCQPCGKALVIREIRGANGFTTGFKNTLAGPRTACCRRRCGLAFEKLAENSLLSGRSHAISRSPAMKQHTNYAEFEKALNKIAPIYPEIPGLFDDPKDWEER